MNRRQFLDGTFKSGIGAAAAAASVPAFAIDDPDRIKAWADAAMSFSVNYHGASSVPFSTEPLNLMMRNAAPVPELDDLVSMVNEGPEGDEHVKQVMSEVWGRARLRRPGCVQTNYLPEHHDGDGKSMPLHPIRVMSPCYCFDLALIGSGGLAILLSSPKLLASEMSLQLNKSVVLGAPEGHSNQRLWYTPIRIYVCRKEPFWSAYCWSDVCGLVY